MRIEAGQLDRAADIVEQLDAKAKKHGFDFWVLVGATQQAAIARWRHFRPGTSNSCAPTSQR